MKKHYQVPEVSLDFFENSNALLADSPDYTADSSIEGFVDNGDVITW